MFLSTLLIFLHGCPDPTTAADLGNPGPGGAAPGAADGPGPHEADGGLGPPPAPDQFDVGAEGGISITGQLDYSGDREGQVRLDFLRTDGDAPPHLLHVEKLDNVGAFTMRVPANTGPVTIVAFVDVDNDGPSISDPAGLVQLAIEESPITSLTIELSDSPDLGALTPGNAPPPTAEASGSAPENVQIEPLKAPTEEPKAETNEPASTAETPSNEPAVDPTPPTEETEPE